MEDGKGCTSHQKKGGMWPRSAYVRLLLVSDMIDDLIRSEEGPKGGRGSAEGRETRCCSA